MDKEIERKRILVIEEASLTIKKILSQAILNKEAKSSLRSKCNNIISITEHKLIELGTDKEFIRETIRGLKSSFLRWYNQIIFQLERVVKIDNSGIVSQTLRNIKGLKITKNTNAFIIGGSGRIGMEKIEITNLRELMTIYDEAAAGRYADYVGNIKKTIISIQDSLASNTLSLYDAKGRNKSLRGMAEIKTRYDLITNDLQKLKDKGTKFVVSSAHANASERCSWWQGKIFVIDLDITTRKLGQYPGRKPSQRVLGHIDGKPYYSLKEACENGFLSYNCQHRLVAYYKGIHIPKYSITDVRRRRGISQKQRYLENRIRQEKSKQILAVNSDERKKARLKSKELQERYAEFCKLNDVPRYDWRTSVTEVERNFNPRLNRGYISHEIDITSEQEIELEMSEKALILYDKAVETEPIITKDIKEAVIKNGGYCEGLEYRLKTKESLERKMKSEYLKLKQDPQNKEISKEELIKQAIENMHDVNRYTAILDPDNFVVNYFKINAELKEKGYLIYKCKNTFKIKDATYRGINNQYMKDGQYLELQFHTKESFDLKNGILHKLYEEERSDSTSLNRKIKIQAEEKKLSNALIIPTNIDKI